ncbi:ABC transporter permease [Streptomyces varsoviensis]|nr:FtsX-like permease family protein [Streptomyces varsoviensis]
MVLSRYALQTVRARKGGFIGALLALMCAAALITACGALLETGLRGAIPTERYAAAPLVISADQQVHQTTVRKQGGKTKVKHKAKPLTERAWLPYASVDAVRGVDGVRALVPEVTFPAHAVRPDGRGLAQGEGGASYGHAWTSAALTPFTLTQGHAPKAATDVVVDRELADRAHVRPGDRLTVQATGDPRTYRVTGIAAPRGGDLRRQTSLFFSTAEADRLAAHPGQVTAVGVLPEPGADAGRLKRDIGRALTGTTAQVHSGDGRGPVEFLDAGSARVKLISMGAAIGATSLLVGVLVVVGTFALAIQQRHRELALLRAIAATPKQLRKLIGREALLVGLVAGVLGALAGRPLASWLYGRFVALGAVPDSLRPAISVFPMLAAVVAVLLGAWAAARISARRIARIRPAEALTEAAVAPARLGWLRVLAGVLALAGGIVLVVVLSALHTEAGATPVSLVVVIVLAMAVSLLGPPLLRGAVALLAGPLRLARTSGPLATANLRADAARMAGVVTPLALLVGMACTVLFSQATLADAAQRQAREGSRADWVLTSSGPGVPRAAAAAVRRTSGTTAATEVVRGTVRVGLDKYPAQGVTAAGLADTWDPGVRRGSLDRFGADSVAVSERAADDLGLGVGGKLKATLGDGTPVTLTVAAVYADGLGFGDLTVSHTLLSRHIDNPLAREVWVRSSGARDQLADAVRGFPGVRVVPAAEAVRLQSAQRESDAEVNNLAMGLVLAFTAIAVVNTLTMCVSARVREFALLRLGGATRRQVLRMLRVEAAAVLLLAVVLGSGIALADLTAFSIGMTGDASPSVRPLAYALVIGVAALLALTATALPGRTALRPRPAEAAPARE